MASPYVRNSAGPGEVPGLTKVTMHLDPDTLAELCAVLVHFCHSYRASPAMAEVRDHFITALHVARFCAGDPVEGS
jgi:hypothetical protein